MKHPMMHSRRVRYGGMTVSLTATLIAALVLLNIIFSTLAHHRGWYIDMTPEPVFTLSDKAKDLLADVDPAHEVTIMFCDDKDAWEADTAQLEVLKTALDMELAFDNIHVEYVDIFTAGNYMV